MTTLKNIEASAFMRGTYVGYATYKGVPVVYRIKRNGKEWLAHTPNANAPMLRQKTLKAMSDSLSDLELIGKRLRFAYPIAFTTLPDYTAHAGQVVTVIRQLTDAECDPECQPMFEVRADDGWTGHADASELVEV